jgi:hypothetical protein
LRIAIVGAALALCLAGRAAAGEVVVLRGGVAIELKQPWVLRGGSALLTRKDGTLLSVPVSEIDLKATAAAKSRSASPPARSRPASRSASTPAVAAKVSRNLPKSKVRITDAQVSHNEAAAHGGSEKTEGRSFTGAARVGIPQYDQERAGSRLIVRGTLRNDGAAPAESLRMSVHALDGKGETIAAADARLSKGMIEPGKTVDFTATLDVGESFVGTIRFFPQWAGAPQGLDTR